MREYVVSRRNEASRKLRGAVDTRARVRTLEEEVKTREVDVRILGVLADFEGLADKNHDRLIAETRSKEETSKRQGA